MLWSTNILYPALLVTLFCSPAVSAHESYDDRDAALQMTLQGSPEANPPTREQYQLDPNWDVYAPPQTRIHYWDIRAVPGAPDGYNRQIITVNGQFPGPLIEANQGDTIYVLVTNNFMNATGIHWHGLDQVGTNWMDGLIGINQCPIPVGGSYPYAFRVPDQYGTYWWHSHYAVQYTDGLQGPLVIHSPNDPLPRRYGYVSDQVLMIDGWWHKDANTTAYALLAGTYPPFGTVGPPPNTTLINGVGKFNCIPSSAPNGCNSTVTAKVPEIHVAAGHTHRLRFINSGTHAQQFVSVDNHTLRVIEADDTPVDGPLLHRVPMHNGQRYSVLLNATTDKPGDAYWLRAILNPGSNPYPPSVFGWNQSPNMSAIVRITYPNGTVANNNTPGNWDWPDTYNTNIVTDIPTANLTPINLQIVPKAEETAFFNFTLNQKHGLFTVNNVSYTNHPWNSTLYALLNHHSIDPTQLSFHFFNKSEGVDIVVNNLDVDPAIDHPYHLHGRSFWIVAEGNGTLTQEGLSKVKFNTNQPLRRDVTVLPRGTWKVLRIRANDPGVWGMHCHIGWHLALGFLGAVIIQYDEIMKFGLQGGLWYEQCAMGDPNAIIPGFQEGAHEHPAARALDRLEKWE